MVDNIILILKDYSRMLIIPLKELFLSVFDRKFIMPNILSTAWIQSLNITNIISFTWLKNKNKKYLRS